MIVWSCLVTYSSGNDDDNEYSSGKIGQAEVCNEYSLVCPIVWSCLVTYSSGKIGQEEV